MLRCRVPHPETAVNLDPDADAFQTQARKRPEPTPGAGFGGMDPCVIWLTRMAAIFDHDPMESATFPFFRVLTLLGLVVVMISGPYGRADTVYAVSATTGELISYDSGDPAGTRTTLLTSGSLVTPVGIAIGPDGNLYIGENGDGSTFAPRISKYEPATLTLSTVYPFAGFEVFPGSLVFQGNDLLIGRNPFFGNTGEVVKLANATGGALAISDYTSGGLASSPGLALAADGQLYVSDQTYSFGTSIASGPVKRFDASGVYVAELIADGASGLAGPSGLLIDGTTLYTASYMNGVILQTDLGSDTTSTFGTTGSPLEAGALALLGNGDLLVGSISGTTGNIYHFGSDGTLVGTFPSGLGEVGGIAVVPEPAAFAFGASVLLTGWTLMRRRRLSRAA